MTGNCYEHIRENYVRISQQIADAAQKAGADPQSVTLMAATKTIAPKAVNYAIGLGLKSVGENRVQELLGKYDQLNLRGCDCQFIGRLQTNKIKYLLDKVSQIQSIDSMDQVKTLSRLQKKTGGQIKILVEVNIGEEVAKGGVAAEALHEFIDEARQYVFVNGLMAIPPICDNPSKLSEYFLRMRQYYVDIGAKKMDNVSMSILSMGMSSDFAEAIACGSNMVRVGTALFGKRNY